MRRSGWILDIRAFRIGAELVAKFPAEHIEFLTEIVPMPGKAGTWRVPNDRRRLSHLVTVSRQESPLNTGFRRIDPRKARRIHDDAQGHVRMKFHNTYFADCLIAASAMAGCAIPSLYAGIAGSHVRSLISHGILAR